MATNPSQPGALFLDAEALYRELASAVEDAASPRTASSASPPRRWLAERLAQDLGLKEEPGVISSRCSRDFARAGWRPPRRRPWTSTSRRPHPMLDDVLYTGRTTRAVINELSTRPPAAGFWRCW